jgi:hypothetical protein
MEATANARQWPVNTFPWQPNYAPVSTIPITLLGNSTLNKSLNNGGILGRRVSMQSMPRLYLYSKDEQKKVSQPWAGSSE